jgi:nitroimidazol reductase NimA-like FMN-containing flavoprotein (pyridoxamine 5'-phosphate oxidase superfamily)
MRRKDREMPREFAEKVVDTCVYGVLSTVNEDGSPYGVALSFARDGEWLYFHGAREGQKIDNLKRSNQVCLVCVGDTHRPDNDFTIEFESAVVYGTAAEVTEDAEKIHALRLLCERHNPANMAAFDGAVAKSLAVTAVWKIHMDGISGKKRKPSGT